MKNQWIAVAVLSAAFAAGCGEKSAENPQDSPQPDGTTVTVPQEPGTPANLQPAPADVSPNRDAVGTTSRPRTSQPARVETRPAPIAAEAPRVNAAPAPRPAPVVRFVTIPAGTALPLELTTAVSSETAQVETPVTARLRRAVMVEGETILPAGTVVNGEVSEVDRAGRVKGRSRLALRFTSVVIDGRRESLRTNPVAFEGEATKIGAGAGIGAAIGGLLGGGSGAAKGAAIGGAAGTGAVLATRGKDVELASGSEVTPTLASPVEVEVR